MVSLQTLFVFDPESKGSSRGEGGEKGTAHVIFSHQPSAEVVKFGAITYAAVRIQFQVREYEIIGSLRMHRTHEGATVRQGPGPGATPIKGTVAPDGTLTAQWQSFRATGKLMSDKAELRWKGQCGPRVAIGTRLR